MAVALDRTIRKILEKAITGKDGARELAERGARNALIEIGLEDARRPEGLSQVQIELRNRLRARARSAMSWRPMDRSKQPGWCARLLTSTGTARCLPASWPRTIC